MKFFNDFIEVSKIKNRLPHWQQDEATFFVTWRLADSIPKEKMDEWFVEKNKWLEENSQPWDEKTEAEYHSIFSAEMESMMDSGHGKCVLRKPECLDVLVNVFGKYEGVHFLTHGMVIMPNHVHVLFTLAEGVRLEKVVQGWKRVSAIGINRVVGTQGNLWQKDYFDRMIRDWKHMARMARYIRKNPLKAKLRTGEYFLQESELVESLLR